MFRNRLHREHLPWYLNSPHKDRIDHAGKTLLDKRYREDVIQQHLNEWIRFSHWLSQKKISLPLHLFSKDSEHYLQVRLAKVGASRRRMILAALKIFLAFSTIWKAREKTPFALAIPAWP